RKSHPFSFHMLISRSCLGHGGDQVLYSAYPPTNRPPWSPPQTGPLGQSAPMPLPLTPSQPPAPDPLWHLWLRLLSHRAVYGQYRHQGCPGRGNEEQHQDESISHLERIISEGHKSTLLTMY